MNGNQTDGNRIRKLTKNNSAFVSLPKVLAEECTKVFAKECNHEGSPGIISRADNKTPKKVALMRTTWHADFIFSICTFRPGEKSRLKSMLNVITVINF